MIQPDLHAALLPVLRALTGLGVRHFVTGSIASSALGVPRASIDADVVAELAPGHAGPLVEALRDDYYVPEARLAEAIQERATFNVIHLGTMLKVDVFVARDDADRRAMDRIRFAHLETGTELPISSPEDTILAKLHWFRRGAEVSERQWADVIGLLRVSSRLDTAYLDEGATERGVIDLLQKARAEAAMA